jgi:hypothetical protein
MDPTRLRCKFLTAWVSPPRRSGGQHYTLQNSYIETLQHILPNIPDNGTIDAWLPLAQNHEQWKTLGTEWIKHWQALTIDQYGPHPLLGDGILHHQFFWYLQDIHCRFSMNDGHVWSITLSMFFLSCYDLTTILRSRALHQVLSSAIQYAWCSYILSRLYRKVETFRSNLLTYLLQFVRLTAQGSDGSLANFNHQPDMHFKYHPEGAHIVYSSKGNQEVLQVVMHESNHCSTSQTSLQYP